MFRILLTSISNSLYLFRKIIFHTETERERERERERDKIDDNENFPKKFDSLFVMSKLLATARSLNLLYDIKYIMLRL